MVLLQAESKQYNRRTHKEWTVIWLGHYDLSSKALQNISPLRNSNII
jgi:hypothetical protein